MTQHNATQHNINDHIQSKSSKTPLRSVFGCFRFGRAAWLERIDNHTLRTFGSTKCHLLKGLQFLWYMGRPHMTNNPRWVTLM